VNEATAVVSAMDDENDDDVISARDGYGAIVLLFVKFNLVKMAIVASE
jgi:hypothetical protein